MTDSDISAAPLSEKGEPSFPMTLPSCCRLGAAELHRVIVLPLLALKTAAEQLVLKTTVPRFNQMYTGN
jgi:hypothetical protein